MLLSPLLNRRHRLIHPLHHKRRSHPSLLHQLSQPIIPPSHAVMPPCPIHPRRLQARRSRAHNIERVPTHKPHVTHALLIRALPDFPREVLIDPPIGLIAAHLLNRHQGFENPRVRRQRRRRLYRAPDHGVGAVAEHIRVYTRVGGEGCQRELDVGECLEGVVRSHQAVYRLGGERFGRFRQGVAQGLQRYRGEGLVETHAVHAPGVLQLVSAPQGGDGAGFVRAEMGGQFFGNGFGAQERAVEVECDYGLVRGGHVERVEGVTPRLHSCLRKWRRCIRNKGELSFIMTSAGLRGEAEAKLTYVERLP